VPRSMQALKLLVHSVVCMPHANQLCLLLCMLLQLYATMAYSSHVCAAHHPAGILFTTFMSWIPGHTASFLGDNPQVPGEGLQQCCPSHSAGHCPASSSTVVQPVYMLPQHLAGHCRALQLAGHRALQLQAVSWQDTEGHYSLQED
jgi:hypothetical protein